VLPGQLAAARRTIAALQERLRACPVSDPELCEEFERIRWFPLSGEALEQLRADETHPRKGGSDGT
jgi:hypothetical protein